MMNPSEVKKLKELAAFPVIISLIMLVAPSFIITPKIEDFKVVEQERYTMPIAVRQS